MYEHICTELLSIIPNIRWDEEGCNAIYKAVKILKKVDENNKTQERTNQ